MLLQITFPSQRRVMRCRRIIDHVLELSEGAPELLQVLTRAGLRIRKLDQLSELICQMPELVCLPAALDLPGEDAQPNVHHIGAANDLDRREPAVDWTHFDARPILFASLGSNGEILPSACWKGRCRKSPLTSHWLRG